MLIIRKCIALNNMNDYWCISTESEPECDIAIDTSDQPIFVRNNSSVEVGCSLNYSGGWIPVILCDSNITIFNTTNDGYVIYWTSLIVSGERQHFRIKCTTYFDGQHRCSFGLNNIIESNAVPGLNFTWQSPVIHLESKSIHCCYNLLWNVTLKIWKVLPLMLSCS